ncbi:MAG: type II secretion system secretin GspD [Methylococcaceae bacterium]
MNNFKKITTNTCVLVMGLSLVGCELLPFKQAAKLPLNPVKKEEMNAVFKQLENKAPVVETPSELYRGTDRFVSGATQQNRNIVPKGTGSYSLNFDEADLGEVAKVILGDILAQNYVLSPKVAGKVTLQTTDPLTKEELLPTLEMVLRMNNAALIKNGKIYHIEPTADALFLSDMSASRSGYQTRVIPVKNVGVQDIVDIIKPLVHEKTILTVDAKRNILVASGTADEIARVLDMIGTFDIDVLKGRSFGLFPLTHVDPKTVIEELQTVFYQKGKGEKSEFFQFIPIQRLNAVLAVTHQAHYLEDIEDWIFRLDKANTASGGGVNVYKVQHAEAKKLAATLNQIFTGSKSKDTSASIAPGETADTMSNQDPTNTGNSPSNTGGSPFGSSNTPSNLGGNPSNSSGMPTGNMGTFAVNQSDENSSTGNSGAFAANESDKEALAGNLATGGASISNIGKVKIIADEANNSIVIVATAQDYEVILPVITQLDVMPLQVLIDATVLQVDLTDDLQYGIAWYFQHGGSSISSNIPKGGLGGAVQTVGQGLSAYYTSGQLQALLTAQASLNKLNVISSPSLMVLNNQKAKINVGDQVPISTGSTSIPLAGTAPSIAVGTSIQYKDTGVTLEVTPRVNANGMVIMKIKQIVSDVKGAAGSGTTTSQTASPTISKKEIDSSVAVHDGETIVMGGLIKNSLTEINSGIPWLYQLPLIGSLFGTTVKNNIKNELVVLITPRVVASKQDSRVISNEFKRKLTGIYHEEVSQGGASLSLPQKDIH